MSDEQLLLFDRGNPPPPPGAFIREELQKRGWGQADLAKIIGRPLPAVNEVIKGKRQLLPEMAVALGKAFGTTPDLWLHREAAYRLSLVEQENQDVSNRARVYEVAPVKEMEKRNWIRPTRQIHETEREVCRFLEVNDISESPPLAVNARANAPEGLNTSQIAWCYRAKKLARTLQAKTYREKHISELKIELRNLSKLARCAEDVVWLLADYGIRLVVIEHLPRCKIDGAALWLSEDAPVIALSLRYDRIDYFWFTLMHELSHIEHRDAERIDAEIAEPEPATDPDCIEDRANRDAVNDLVGQSKLESFIRRNSPIFLKKSIIQFANTVGTHPGIVVGQLQRRGEIGWSSGRAMQVKVRDFVIRRALTDGWGSELPYL